MKKKLLIGLAFFLLTACGMNKDLGEQNKLVVSDSKYYIYYDNEILEIQKGVYITNENKIEDYFSSFLGLHVKDEKKLLSDLERYFPHKINGVQKGEKPKNFKSIPSIKIGDKVIVNSLQLEYLLAEETLIAVDDTSDIIKVKEVVDANLEGKLVYILNANRMAGFAKKLGMAFEENLKMKYIAENYSKESNVSYIINNKLSQEDFDKFVNSLSIKYIKVKKDDKLKPEADVILITGNDAKVNFTIEVLSTSENSELKTLLSDYKLKVQKSNENISETTIKHRAEDILIAKKLLGYLPTAKLVQDDSIAENKIVITTNK